MHGRLAAAVVLSICSSCEKTLDPSVIREDARVSEVSLQILESFPVQIRAVVRGEYPDGCTGMDSIESSREGNEFRLHLITARPAGSICTLALVPFEEVIPLDVAGLRAGEYRVVANGVAATFTLDLDNG